jgi:Zn-dependent protease
VLCWIAASGLKRGKPWSHPVGILTSALLLVGFPWIAIAGGIGLFMLLDPSWHTSTAAAAASSRPGTDFWDSKRKSKAQAFVLTLFGIAALPLLGWFILYAHRAGMPAWRGGWRFWFWYSVFALVNTTLHESGHAIVAWAAGFELRVICIGPFTFWRERARSRFQFRFDLGRLFERDGYMGAVPVSDSYLRPYEIAVTAAGPMANAISCLVCLVVFFYLPGTAWQAWWWVAAFNAVLAGVLAVSSLIPLGYCDGTMLLHLILWTPQGRLLLDIKRLARLGDEAKDCHERADFAKEIELREAMLQLALAHGRDNASMAAVCQQAMGSAWLLADDGPAAEYRYRKCLEYGAELARNPALAANVWSGLLFAVTRRHRVAHVCHAGPDAPVQPRVPSGSRRNRAGATVASAGPRRRPVARPTDPRRGRVPPESG